MSASPADREEAPVDAPPVPGRRSRTGVVLGGVLLAIVLIVASGFVFDLPYGFGGWELVILATPIVAAIVVLGLVLRSAGRR
jgi:hypothetical protein